MMRFTPLALLALLVGVGCGHAAMRGSVVMKISDSQAHVCLGNNEVAVGDHVRLIKHKCTSSSKPAVRQCTPVVIAEGQVTQVLNEHYSVVDFPPGTAFVEGDSVEKVK